MSLSLVVPFALASAQVPTADTVRLGALQASAVLRDPRSRGLELLSAQSRLRRLNLDAEHRPSLSVESRAQYQSDVARIPIVLPGGATPPIPPNDTYDAALIAQEHLYDPTLGSRLAVEDAQVAESRSRLRASLFAVRQNVNDLFFAVLRTQAQIAEMEATIADLEARRGEAEARVREGSALPSEALTIRAEVLRRQQAIANLGGARHAWVAMLADLTGRALDSVPLLGLPDLGAAVSRARGMLPELRARPEYVQFARTRDLLQRRADALAAQGKPRVSAFGRTGYGRPGLNPLSDRFDGYWLAGVQLQWAPWQWGTTGRDREVLSLQQQIVSADEQQFTESLRRGVAQDLATIERLEGLVSSDDEIVAIREQIATEVRARFGEGVVTAADYVDRQTDVLGARIGRALHRVELAQARARFLTTLGVEVR